MTRNRKTVPIDALIAYESGEINAPEEIAFFQGLIDSGLVWQLQGHYGRRATELIEAGLCTLGKKECSDAYGKKVPSKDEVFSRPAPRGNNGSSL